MAGNEIVFVDAKDLASMGHRVVRASFVDYQRITETIRPWPSSFISEVVELPEAVTEPPSPYQDKVLEIVRAGLSADECIPSDTLLTDPARVINKIYCLDTKVFRGALGLSSNEGELPEETVQKITDWIGDARRLYQQRSSSLVPCVVVLGSFSDLMRYSQRLVSAGAILFQKPDFFDDLSDKGKIDYLISELHLGEQDYQHVSLFEEPLKVHQEAEAPLDSKPDLGVYVNYPVELGDEDFQDLISRMSQTDDDSNKK